MVLFLTIVGRSHSITLPNNKITSQRARFGTKVMDSNPANFPRLTFQYLFTELFFFNASQSLT